METRHSPEPWEVIVMGGRVLYVEATSGVHVAEWDVPHSDAEHYANARLIAAAPDLLEACKALDHCGLWGMIANHWGRAKSDKLRKPLQAAIRKAEGGH